ncbi:hypothetical protein [uncultured Amnibacterium sp.]|uniref:hypothetical protein n=1 Tax=uncultured Amnibacterium sp. TaxID=1631851 RepID=UPI0035CC71FE
MVSGRLVGSEQQSYQVRFDWGVAGAHAVAADADVLVWIDALDPAPAPLTLLPGRPAVVEAALPDAVAIAAWILALQEQRQRRTVVALIAAGAARGDGLRFAVEDLLTAGAVVDALESRGIDAFSPEAAAADAAYRTLKGAVGHLFRSAAGGASVPDSALRIDPVRTPADVVVRRPSRAP